jgi:hypothetical protein
VVEVIPPQRSAGLIKRADLDRRPDPQGFSEADFDQRPSFTVDRMASDDGSRSSLPPPRATGRPTDETASYLYGMARTTGSKLVRESVMAILEERDAFLRLAQAVARAVEIGQITPELASLATR